MEKAGMMIWITCVLFAFSCGETSNDSKPEQAKQDAAEASPTRNPTVSVGMVEWMYMDDSLYDLSRSFQYYLPWMQSDIRELPEMITPEIVKLPQLSSMERVNKEKTSYNDTVHVYAHQLSKDDCHCIVYRVYEGDPQSKQFKGYRINEGIECNFKPTITKSAENRKKEEEKHDAYEVKGHDH